MNRVIFIDIDGTLVDLTNVVPDSASYAIKKARANGDEVYLCTGRSMAEIYPNILDVGFDGIIAAYGAYIELNGKVLVHNHISKEKNKELVDYLNSKNYPFYLEANSGLYGNMAFKEVMKQFAKKHSTKEKPLDIHSVFPGVIYTDDLYKEDVNKISYVIEKESDIQDTIKHFPELKHGTWGSATDNIFGEVGMPGIDKGKSIDYLLGVINGKDKEIYGFGDSKGDVEMFERCDHKIAMVTGEEVLKNLADYITDGIWQDGIYNGFVHFGIIEK